VSARLLGLVQEFGDAYSGCVGWIHNGPSMSVKILVDAHASARH
jgi:hypothetical protein